MTTVSNGESQSESEPEEPKDLGFWRELWIVLKEDIPGTRNGEPGEQRVKAAILAGCVIPAVMTVFGLLRNQFGFEAMTWVGSLYVALTALFAVHSLQPSNELNTRMKRIMPAIIVSSGVTASLLVVMTFILKANHLV